MPNVARTVPTGEPGAALGELDDALGELDAALGGDARLVTDPDVMAGYAGDQANIGAPGSPAAVLLAASQDDVVAALQWASRHAVPVVPRGAGSGLSGGAAAIDGCLVLSVAGMDRILEVVPEDQYAVVQPGVINGDLDAAAGEHGLMYAPDPGSRDISSIGGNLATNAGGLRCVKYGVTRDSVLGLTAVLADGRVLRAGRRTVKGVTGYDLTALMVGSEGTLGVITEATMRLRPLPAEPPITVLGSFASMAAAGEAVAALVRAGVVPTLLELMDRAVVRAVDEYAHMGLGDDAAAILIGQADGGGADRTATALERAFTEAGASDVARSSTAEEADQLLEMRRLAYPAAEQRGAVLVEDVGVPRSRLPRMLAELERIGHDHEVEIMTVAHAGDGNLHPKFVFDPAAGEVPAAVWAAADEVFRTALELGGTLTGEHGVGTLKQRWLGQELDETSRQVHAAVKHAFDPQGILNPGKCI